MRRAKIPAPGPPPALGDKSAVNGTQQKKTLSNGTTTTSAPAPVPAVVTGTDGLPDVRIPLKTVEEGVEFLKARVRDVVEVVEAEALREGEEEEGGGSSDEE